MGADSVAARLVGPGASPASRKPEKHDVRQTIAIGVTARRTNQRTSQPLQLASELTYPRYLPVLRIRSVRYTTLNRLVRRVASIVVSSCSETVPMGVCIATLVIGGSISGVCLKRLPAVPAVSLQSGCYRDIRNRAVTIRSPVDGCVIAALVRIVCGPSTSGRRWSRVRRWPIGGVGRGRGLRDWRAGAWWRAGLHVIGRARC